MMDWPGSGVRTDAIPPLFHTNLDQFVLGFDVDDLADILGQHLSQYRIDIDALLQRVDVDALEKAWKKFVLRKLRSPKT